MDRRIDLRLRGKEEQSEQMTVIHGRYLRATRFQISPHKLAFSTAVPLSICMEFTNH